jgi:integrase
MPKTPAPRLLTARAIDHAKPRASDWFLWDHGNGAVRGFGCRIYPSGRKQFVVQYSLGPRGAAKTYRFELGDYPGTNVDVARGEAGEKKRSAREALRRKAPDLDPAVQRAAQREQALGRKEEERRQRLAPTVADLVPRFLKAGRRRLKPKTLVEWERFLAREVVDGDPLGVCKVDEVTAAHLETWHEARADRPVLANNGLAVLRLLFKYAAKQRLRTAAIDTREITRHRVQRKRKRLLAPDEYTALGKALTVAEHEGLPVPPSLAKHDARLVAKRATALGARGPYQRHAPPVGPTAANPFAVAAIRFLALSGWRREEALSLRRDAVDTARRVAILDDSKTGRSARPLGPAALAVLAAVPVIEGSPYFFPGLTADSHLTPPKRLWTAVRYAAGVSVTLHGLRHAFTTVARELGYGDHVIARLVGHVLQGMTSRYGDVPEATVSEAADRVSALIAARLDGSTSPVVSLDAARHRRDKRRA